MKKSVSRNIKGTAYKRRKTANSNHTVMIERPWHAYTSSLIMKFSQHCSTRERLSITVFKNCLVFSAADNNSKIYITRREQRQLHIPNEMHY